MKRYVALLIAVSGAVIGSLWLARMGAVDAPAPVAVARADPIPVVIEHEAAWVAPSVQLTRPITITAQPMQDAPLFLSYDTGNKWVDPLNTALGPTLRLGENQPWRPDPGMVEEIRAGIEFDLSPLLALGEDDWAVWLSKATLKLEIKELMAGSVPLGEVQVLAYGYVGDGAMTWDDDFEPTDLVSLGTVVITQAGPLELDVTPWIWDMRYEEHTWGGVLLRVDVDSLPLPEEDTTFGANVHSADETGHQPLLVIEPPGRVNDLLPEPWPWVAEAGPGGNKLELTWTEPGPSCTGSAPAVAYDIRYSAAPINEGNWASAQPLDEQPTPTNPCYNRRIAGPDLAHG
jgi:hypothetical protein